MLPYRMLFSFRGCTFKTKKQEHILSIELHSVFKVLIFTNMNEDPHIHDKFIQAILSDRKIAGDYFRNFLPEFVSKHLDFSSITQLPNSYLSDELKKTMSDIVYTCNKKDGSDTVKVSLLIEHKSYPDKNVAIQIGSYIFSALQMQVRNKEPLSIVVPVLLYHGKMRWKYRSLGDLFESLEDGWRAFLPDFKYIYNDLGALADEEIEALDNNFLAASFLTLKHSVEKKWIEQNAAVLLLLASKEQRGLRRQFIIYLSGRGEFKEKALNSLPLSIKQEVMNTLDIYTEKRRKEGFEEGIQKGMEKGIEQGKEEKGFDIVENLINKLGLDDQQAAEIAEVPVSFVLKVRKTLRKKK